MSPLHSLKALADFQTGIKGYNPGSWNDLEHLQNISDCIGCLFEGTVARDILV
jgi:hypothetical protein